MSVEKPKRGFRPAEAAAYSGRPRSALYEAMRDGQLPSFKIGRSRLILREDLDQYIDNLTKGQSPQR